MSPSRAIGSDEHTWLAVDAAGLGTWELDLATGRRRWSRRCLELFGLESEHDLTPERIAQAIHPDDRGRWRDALARALESESGGEYRVEYRTGSAEPRWIAATGKVFFEGGRPVRAIGTVQDVTARKTAEREREIFLGALGHDLRSPLSTIMIHSVLLRRRAGPSVDGSLGRIDASAKRMARMIDDLLDFARSRTGELQIRRAAVDLVAVCREVLYEVGFPHPERTIEFTHSGETVGEWDGDRIGQVVQNLASNAIAHGAPSSPIEVSVEGLDDVVRISVKNRGRPVSEEMREHLFDPFRRGRTPGGGAGLGLYIAKQIVAGHRGTIDFVSDEERTVFRVELPRR
jgi:PAS domain S-box-containing protein